ncbi:MAG: hypothetical protein QXR64_08200 [Pyrobaculum sp.]
MTYSLKGLHRLGQRGFQREVGEVPPLDGVWASYRACDRTAWG